MAFPTTSTLDDFNRADQDPIAGSWAGPTYAGDRQLRVASNECATHSVDGYGNSYWNAGTFGPDVELYCTLTSSWPSGARIYLDFRMSGMGGTVLGYRVRFSNDAGDHHVWVYKDGVVIDDFDPADTFATGDSFGASMIGSTITAYRKPSAGAWTSLGTTSDTTYTTANYVGLSMQGGTGMRLDDFGGGTVVASSAFFYPTRRRGR